MRIRCTESPNSSQIGQEFVLKLIDARFLKPLRIWFLDGDSADAEISTIQRFVDMVCCGQVDAFLKQVDASLYEYSHWDSTEYGAKIRDFQLWQKEALMYRHCISVAQTELDAYSRLQELQGTCIPKIIWKVRTCPWMKLDHPFDRFFQYPGFVMEDVAGVCLAEIGKLPRHMFTEICEETVRVLNSLEYYGIEHRSLAARNIMLKHRRRQNGRPHVVLIDLHKHLMWSPDDSYYKYRGLWDAPEKLMKGKLMKGLKWYDRVLLSQTEVALEHEQEWNELIATGRFAERELFTKGTRPHDLTRERIAYRVIMDDIWHVSDRRVLLQELGRKAKMSRIAYKISKVRRSSGTSWARTDYFQDDIETTSFFWEIEKWPQRVLPKIAEALDCRVDGIWERFDEALEKYYARPNGPGRRLDGLSRTIFPNPEDSQESFNTASSIDNLNDSQESLTKDDVVKIFVPRKQPLPPMDLDSYELGWM
jgi:hypothetical protein